MKLPSSIRIVEVAPRDGLQSFTRRVDTAQKLELIALLTDAGFTDLEITAFARPQAIPYLDDAEELCRQVPRLPGVNLRALAPNARGAQRAVAAGIDHVVGLLTASATYTRKNQNMTPDQAADQAIASFEVAAGAGLGYSAAIGMAMWCPFEGRISALQVDALVQRLHGAGIRQICLAGSMGMEDPVQVHALFQAMVRRWSDTQFGYHVHNMAGFGAANILAALQGGACWIEGAVCGLGGGVATPQAVGNYPTEDIVHLLELCGVSCGLDASRVAHAAQAAARLLGMTPASHAARHGPRRQPVRVPATDLQPPET